MPRAPKSKTPSKPYAKPPGTPKKKTEAAASKATGEYDRRLLVELVAKATTADFEKVGVAVAKTATQCKDTWRKTLCNAILAGGDWCVTGPGWTADMKQIMADEIFNTAKPNWDLIAPYFPGKTVNQVRDVWRKVVAPKIKKGQSIG